MTINENGRRKRISKHKVVVKQLMKQAMTGNPQALRIYFDRHQEALERVALVAGAQPDEELMRIATAGLEKTEQESGKGHVSNTE